MTWREWACASGTVAEYKADGTYWAWGEEGTWILEGDRKTMTLTKVHEDSQAVQRC